MQKISDREVREKRAGWAKASAKRKKQHQKEAAKLAAQENLTAQQLKKIEEETQKKMRAEFFRKDIQTPHTPHEENMAWKLYFNSIREEGMSPEHEAGKNQYLRNFMSKKPYIYTERPKLLGPLRAKAKRAVKAAARKVFRKIRKFVFKRKLEARIKEKKTAKESGAYAADQARKKSRVKVIKLVQKKNVEVIDLT